MIVSFYQLEDSEEILQRKCEQLADIIQRSRKTVIYTGAGISTVSCLNLPYYLYVFYI